jgi:hypothetical protein
MNASLNATRAARFARIAANLDAYVARHPGVALTLAAEAAAAAREAAEAYARGDAEAAKGARARYAEITARDMALSLIAG